MALRELVLQVVDGGFLLLLVLLVEAVGSGRGSGGGVERKRPGERLEGWRSASWCGCNQNIERANTHIRKAKGTKPRAMGETHTHKQQLPKVDGPNSTVVAGAGAGS